MTATKIQPGDDLHLTSLMAPHSLNFVTGADRAALLAYGRDVFAAALDSKCLAQIEEPAGAAPAAVAPQGVVAWMTPEGDRVVTAETMDGARKDGGASLSSLRPYTVALVRGAVAPALEAPAAHAPALPDGWRLVPIEFLRGFGTLAHNYSLTAIAPDHYWGNERSAFSDAYARCGQDLGRLRDMLSAEAPPLAAAPQAPAAPVEFQQRVQPWMMACFGAEIAADRAERNHRFLEEALELVQACGCTASEAHQLVDYVFGRPLGEPAQEVGGVMVTLAALCLANSLDMHAAGETELARIWGKVEQIRAKQAAKPKHSPLPAAPAAPAVDAKPLFAPETELDAVVRDAEQIIRDAEHYRFIKRHRLILSGGTDTFGWPIAPFGDECDRYIAQELATERAAQAKEGGA